MWASAWFVNSANPIFFAAWLDEDAVVAYQSTSGDCHLISAMGAAVLELLQLAPHSAEAIFKDLFPAEEPTDSAIETLRNNFLLHFEQLGLIQKFVS